MSYEEFTARKWTVVGAGLAAKHTTGDIVTFAGSENEVSIQCKRYEDGMYEEDKNQIVVGDFIITLTVGLESYIINCPLVHSLDELSRWYAAIVVLRNYRPRKVILVSLCTT
jgi:hypothetical protein